MAFVSTIKLRVDQKGFKEACVLTGHLNVPKILELAPNNGRDPLTGQKIGPPTGTAVTFKKFGQL